MLQSNAGCLGFSFRSSAETFSVRKTSSACWSWTKELACVALTDTEKIPTRLFGKYISSVWKIQVDREMQVWWQLRRVTSVTYWKNVLFLSVSITEVENRGLPVQLDDPRTPQPCHVTRDGCLLASHRWCPSFAMTAGYKLKTYFKILLLGCRYLFLLRKPDTKRLQTPNWLWSDTHSRDTIFKKMQ